MSNITESHGYWGSKTFPVIEKEQAVLSAFHRLIHDMQGLFVPWYLNASTPKHHGRCFHLEHSLQPGCSAARDAKHMAMEKNQTFRSSNKDTQLWRKILGFNPLLQSCLVTRNACSLKKKRKKKQSRKQPLEQELSTSNSWIFGVMLSLGWFNIVLLSKAKLSVNFFYLFKIYKAEFVF